MHPEIVTYLTDTSHSGTRIIRPKYHKKCANYAECANCQHVKVSGVNEEAYNRANNDCGN